MYENGTATGIVDLLQKLFTFAVSAGWTSDQQDTGAGQFALHRGNVYPSYRYNTTTPTVLGIYQALGYTGGQAPGNHPNDSGNGVVSSTNSLLDDERSIPDIGAGPYPSYYFFENDASTPYIHAVVEISTDVFRHFGFGNLVKHGTWTGGEYVYGQRQNSGTPSTTGNVALLDGLFSTSSASDKKYAPTLHMEGLPGQAGASKWGQVWGDALNTEPVDRAGNAKVNVQGGFKGGPLARNFGFYPAGAQSGLLGLYPIRCWYRDDTNNFAYLIGDMPEIRGLNIAAFAPKDEVTVGSDTWVVFPTSQKTSSGVNASKNQGIAYKKVTT